MVRMGLKQVLGAFLTMEVPMTSFRAWACCCVLLGILVPAGHAQVTPPDLERSLCNLASASQSCIRDRFEIVFPGTSQGPILELDNAAPGQTIEAEVIAEIATPEVRGFSFGVAHDSAVVELDSGDAGLDFTGTVLESLPDGFRRADAVPGGLRLAALLSFDQVDPAILPVGRSTLLRVRYRLLSDPAPEGTMLQFSGALGEPVTEIVLTHDELSFPEVGGGTAPDQEVACRNALDDDGDGLIDRDDPDCVERNGVSGIPSRVVDGLILRTLSPATNALRGDCNLDGAVDIADGIALLVANFAGPSALACRAACDANGDGTTDGTADAIGIFMYRLGSGSPPAAPFPACGLQSSADCEQPPEACP